MPSDQGLLSTLIGSNNPCLELIFMVPKVFEPLKFDCTYKNIVILYTKYEVSVLYSCGGISEEKFGEKENRTYTGKNEQDNASSHQSHDATNHCQLTYKILTFYLQQLLRNLLRKITVLIAWREKKVNKYRKNKFSIP